MTASATQQAMARDSIPELDLREYTQGDEASREEFVSKLGSALADLGFFALKGHGIPLADIEAAYAEARDFFARPDGVKLEYAQSSSSRQRGFIPFGVEHAKDNPTPDLKEFWQTGRSFPYDHPLVDVYPSNIWPTEVQPTFEAVIDGLYIQLEELSTVLLEICSLYLDKPENWLPDMSAEGNTVLRLLHYPPLTEAEGADAVRCAQHEDINFITLLVGATADGLEVMDHDGDWIKVEGNHEHIIVDSGDMLQNLTNGLFRSVPHRVINPSDQASDRYSMPLFTHPHNDVDLTPRPEFVALTGRDSLFPSMTAGQYLHQRLLEIGLVEN